MTATSSTEVDRTNIRISVIGTGYLGATHAACMAELGFEVLGVDVDESRISQLSNGIVPFSEPGLGELLARHVRTGRLQFTTKLSEAAAFGDVHFICVGTPQSRDSHAADLSALFDVVEKLGPLLTRDCLVVGKSTVPVGTAERLATRIADLVAPGLVVETAWAPEFLREGHAVQDTLRPDRLVLGVASPEAEWTLRRIYRTTIDAGVPVAVTDIATAELTKLAANAFLATKISFINAMAEVCELAGTDVVAVADALGHDDRIGRRFLDAGLGFGGGCLPKDIRAFSARASELGADSAVGLLREVEAINLRARARTVDLAVTMCGSTMSDRRIAVLGAAFKPRSDDVRDSPALDVANRLHRLGAHVRVFDPEANDNARAAAPALEYAQSATSAMLGADLVLHLTDWPQFRSLNPQALGEVVRHRRILDARNSLDEDRWRMAGWAYRGLGRAHHAVDHTVPQHAPVTTRLESALRWG